jgi:hypothetical protein
LKKKPYFENKKKHNYCVYFNEKREQFAFTKTERAKKFGLQILMDLMTEESAVKEVILLNKRLDEGEIT